MRIYEQLINYLNISSVMTIILYYFSYLLTLNITTYYFTICISYFYSNYNNYYSYLQITNDNSESPLNSCCLEWEKNPF